MGLVLVSAVDFSVIYELTDMYIALICTDGMRLHEKICQKSLHAAPSQSWHARTRPGPLFIWGFSARRWQTDGVIYGRMSRPFLHTVQPLTITNRGNH